MNILLTNDDGIYAPGLWTLYRQLSIRHRVNVVAPDRERSAVGHGITLNEPLRFNRVMVNGGFEGYAVNGTPVDCIKLGMTEIFIKSQDLVVSGINPGVNVGVNLNYSGTVAAAKEASLYGVPAVSISVDIGRTDRFAEAALFADKLIEKVAKNGLPFGTMLNVNIPNLPMEKVAGVRVSRQGVAKFPEFYEKRTDPRNHDYFWLGPDMQNFEDSPGIDGSVLQKNYISITPIKCDNTDYHFIDELKTWEIDL